jgi:uncharacterized SAM-binding protein YcdF (DUF218 family)
MITIIVINGKKSTTTFKEDSVLVLGSGIKGDVILSTLQLRLDKCLEYIQHNPDVVIVVSGGQGRGEDISEAEAMRRYLIQQNVDSTLIIKEDKSRDTRDNMQYSKIILDSCFTVLGKQNYTTVCITSDFHAYRSSLLAKRFGLNTTSYNSKVKWYIRPSTYCREVLSICKFWFLS